MNNSSAKRASIYLGVFMAVVMIAGVFAPLIRQESSQITTTSSTATVLPTFPSPPEDMSTITFNQVFLHPSGIFSIGQPLGWGASQPSQGVNIAQINLINNDMLAVVDSYVEAAPITSDQLSAHFSEAVINASWSNFSNWQETNRTMQGDHLVIDFTVTLSGRTYVARQQAWTDGSWVYVVRVLVPENATDLLRYLLENFVKSLQPQTEFVNTPFDWDAYYDQNASHIIRYPSDWTLTDSAPGRPASVSSATGGINLRVETRAATSIADEAAARTFVEGLRSGNAVVSVKPVTRGLGQGFSVAYSTTTVDGGQESGLAVLLNGPDGALHVADLRFGTANIDLNTVVLTAADAAAATAEATSEVAANSQAFVVLAEVMSTFYVIEPLNLSSQSLPATATPLPTLALTLAAPTAEVTAEATAAATVEATAAAPSAATAEATAAATAEATAEATAAATAAS